MQGVSKESIWNYLNRQVFLGDDDFVVRMQEKIKGANEDINISKAQRSLPARPLAEFEKIFNLHFTTIGKIVRKAK